MLSYLHTVIYTVLMEVIDLSFSAACEASEETSFLLPTELL